MDRVTRCANCFDKGFLGDLQRLCVAKSRDGICVEADKDFETMSFRIAADKAFFGPDGKVAKVYGAGFVAATRAARRRAEEDLEYRATLLRDAEEKIDILLGRFDEIVPEILEGEAISYFGQDANGNLILERNAAD